jgi:Cellulase M and related proteins
LNLEQLTETLIDIESVTGNEQEILNFIENYLIKNKFTGEIIKNDGGLIAYHSKSNSKVALVGHVDPVPIVDDQKKLSDSKKISGKELWILKVGLAVNDKYPF